MNDLRLEPTHFGYSSVRRDQPDGTPITVLHIGPTQTRLVFGKNMMAEVTFSLDIGSQKTSSDHFKHTPPTANEMENAIMGVEDEIAKAPASLLAGSHLLTSDLAIREIALMAGLADQPVLNLGIADVETTFDRLVSVLQGRPAPSEGLPESAEFAATLLILREFMHHLKFPSIAVIN